MARLQAPVFSWSVNLANILLGEVLNAGGFEEFSHEETGLSVYPRDSLSFPRGASDNATR